MYNNQTEDPCITTRQRIYVLQPDRGSMYNNQTEDPIMTTRQRIHV